MSRAAAVTSMPPQRGARRMGAERTLGSQLAGLLLVFPLSCAVAAQPAVECRWQRQAAGPSAKPLVSEQGYTLRRAQEAMAVVSRLLRPGHAITHSAVEQFQREVGYVTGYVLLARLEDARARRQHDADELVDLCAHWGEHALGLPRTAMVNPAGSAP